MDAYNTLSQSAEGAGRSSDEGTGVLATPGPHFRQGCRAEAPGRRTALSAALRPGDGPGASPVPLQQQAQLVGSPLEQLENAYHVLRPVHLSDGAREYLEVYDD